MNEKSLDEVAVEHTCGFDSCTDFICQARRKDFKAGHHHGTAHQAPISRAEGFMEAIKIMKIERIEMLGNVSFWSAEEFLEQEGIRLGILKGDGE